jgi:hypothetical protein
LQFLRRFNALPAKGWGLSFCNHLKEYKRLDWSLQCGFATEKFWAMTLLLKNKNGVERRKSH